MNNIDIPKILELAPSPAYVIDLGQLRHNLAILDEVQRRSGAKILMALKAFAMWSTFPLIRETLQGVCASSPWEARLGRETFGGEVHSFAAAFKERDIVELLSISDHLVFNSFAQLEAFRPLWEKEHGRVSIGLRVNPEHSEGHTEIYDPCAKNSRLGIPRREFYGKSLAGVDGLHFHTLCEHLFEPLARTAKVFEEKFGEFLPGMKWLNLGGGHHITRAGYDIDGLVDYCAKFDTVEAMLSEMALQTNLDADGVQNAEVNLGEQIRLSTIHQAKGLEWKAVFLLWLSDGMFPSAKSTNEIGGEEEERRLFYVATTRAEDKLFLCVPQVRRKRDGGVIFYDPSRFVQELPLNLLDMQTGFF